MAIIGIRRLRCVEIVWLETAIHTKDIWNSLWIEIEKRGLKETLVLRDIYTKLSLKRFATASIKNIP